MKYYIGIDPGASGAICILDAKGQLIKFIDMKDFVCDELLMYHPLHSIVYVEKVHSMPKQGVASTFTFGVNFGKVLGVLEAYKFKYFLVPPQVWQKVYAKSVVELDPKERSIINAKELLKNKSDLLKGSRGAYKDGRADAFNIAYYAYKQIHEEI